MPKIEIDLEELKELVQCSMQACNECGGYPTGNNCSGCAVDKWEKKLKEEQQ